MKKILIMMLAVLAFCSMIYAGDVLVPQTTPTYQKAQYISASDSAGRVKWISIDSANNTSAAIDIYDGASVIRHIIWTPGLGCNGVTIDMGSYKYVSNVVIDWGGHCTGTSAALIDKTIW